MLFKPRVGMVYTCNYQSGERTRYLIIDAEQLPAVIGEYWQLLLVNIETRRLLDFEFAAERNDDGFVTIEPITEGDAALFLQALIAPQTLRWEGKPHDQPTT